MISTKNCFRESSGDRSTNESSISQIYRSNPRLKNEKSKLHLFGSSSEHDENCPNTIALRTQDILATMTNEECISHSSRHRYYSFNPIRTDRSSSRTILSRNSFAWRNWTITGSSSAGKGTKLGNTVRLGIEEVAFQSFEMQNEEYME